MAYTSRLGQNHTFTGIHAGLARTIYTCTVYSVLSLPKVPLIHCIFMVLANPIHTVCIHGILMKAITIYTVIHIWCIYTVLANPTYVPCSKDKAGHMKSNNNVLSYTVKIYCSGQPYIPGSKDGAMHMNSYMLLLLYVYKHAGLARTVHKYRTWPYIWWFPCQKHCIYTVYVWFWPTLKTCIHALAADVKCLKHNTLNIQGWASNNPLFCMINYTIILTHNTRMCTQTDARTHARTDRRAHTHARAHTQTHTFTPAHSQQTYNAERANTLTVQSHVLGVRLAAPQLVAVSQKDANGLSIALAVSAGKALCMCVYVCVCVCVSLQYCTYHDQFVNTGIRLGIKLYIPKFQSFGV